MLPWCVVVPTLGWNAYISMLIFLILLTFGFIYEWIHGVFDWS
jgi:NADH-quinone oxidoreductase subunit A